MKIVISCLFTIGLMAQDKPPVKFSDLTTPTEHETITQSWNWPDPNPEPMPSCMIHYESLRKFKKSSGKFNVQIYGNGKCHFDEAPKITVSFGDDIKVGWVAVHNANWITAHNVRVVGTDAH